MKPVKFRHQNVIFAENQPEYQQLPALKLDTKEGEVISCWKLSFYERIKILLTGKVWLSLMSFNKPLTPSYLSVNRKDVFSVLKPEPKKDENFLKEVTENDNEETE